jgi:glycosyltransferase involved in cell wall biosynthesis
MLSDTSGPGVDTVTAIYRQSMFWTPEREAPSAWPEHVPFAFWLVDVLRPATIVELGTHAGVSYSAMCQAVKMLGLPARCFAIDTWKGDEHAGFYSEEVYRDLAAFHDPRYGAFSRLVRSTFDDALSHFEDASIHLLHIDGLHTYDAVRHDFLSWRPKLASNAVVILHDTNVRERGFGVFRLWEEISADKPHFSFLHGHGLGVLGLGGDYPLPLRFLFDATNSGHLASSIRGVFAHLGRSVAFLSERTELDALRYEKTHLVSEIAGCSECLTEVNKRVSSLESAVAERDQRIAWLERAAMERVDEIAALQGSVAERDGEIVALNQAATERDQLRTKEKNLQADLEKTQRELDQLRAESEAALTRERRGSAWRDSLLRGELIEADRDRHRLQSALAKLNPALTDLHASQAETLPQNAQDLEHLVAALYTSRSWQVTAPLRWLGNLIRGRKAPPSPPPQGQRRPEELRQLIAAIYASHSWRLAGPLRFVSRRLGAARSRGKPLCGHYKSGDDDKGSGVRGRAPDEIYLATPPPHAGIASNGSVTARREAGVLQDILVVAPHLPLPDFHSGDLRLFTIVELLVRTGRQVVFASIGDRHAHNRLLLRNGELSRYERALLKTGVSHIVYGVDELTAALATSGRTLRLAFIAFPDVARCALPLVRAHAPTARVLYDMVDFHALRMGREAALSGSPDLAEAAEGMRRLECANMEAADLTLAISEEERLAAIQAVPTARVAVLPNLFRVPTGEPPGPDGREGILFVGGFWHKPNVDAVQWFSREIWPLIRAGAPDARFHIVGSNPTHDVISLSRLPGIEVPGYVPDLGPFYTRSRLLAAPLRYGAGMKGKIGQSLAFGLPVVTTPIGTEGMKLRDGHDIVIAQEPAAFAEGCLRLLRDDTLWQQLQRNGVQFVERELSIEVVARILTGVING